MIYYKIFVNEELLSVSGGSDMESLQTSIFYNKGFRDDSNILLSVCGTDKPDSNLKRELCWIRQRVVVGDSIKVEITDTAVASEADVLAEFGNKELPDNWVERFCSFCGISENQTSRMVSGKNGNICQACIDLCCQK